VLSIIQREIKKLPSIMTRQQVLNWYIDTIGHRWGSNREITTGELIVLIEKSGKKVKGQSKLAIHISPEEEREFATKSRADLGQKKINSNVKIPDSEKKSVQKMYWDCGMSLDKIAERYGCSSTTIQKRMREWQLETRARGSNIMASTKSRAIRVGV